MTSNLEIADLQKKLADVEADRHDMANRYYTEKARAEAAEAKLAKVIKKWSAAESEAYDLRAAIPRAYQMGVDAVLSEACWADIAVDTIVEVVTVEAIRAIQPPADLVERAKGGE